MTNLKITFEGISSDIHRTAVPEVSQVTPNMQTNRVEELPAPSMPEQPEHHEELPAPVTPKSIPYDDEIPRQIVQRAPTNQNKAPVRPANDSRRLFRKEVIVSRAI